MSKSNLVLGFHDSGMVGLVDALSDAVGNDFSLSGGLNIGCVWVNHDRVVVFQNERVTKLQKSLLRQVRVSEEG